MTFGLEIAALAALPFAAAMGLGAGCAALDLATGRGIGACLTMLVATAMVPLTFFFLTASFPTDFKTEVFAIAPLTALVGVLVGYGLGKASRAAPSRTR